MCGTFEGMRRVLPAIFFLCCVVISVPLQAAQDLQLRVSENNTYSRLVFEGPGAASGKVDSAKKGQARISFAPAARMEALAGIAAAHLTAISIEKSAPLTLLLRFAEKSRVRSFATGQRLIVDIFAEPGTDKATVKKQPESKQPAQEKPERKKAESKPALEPDPKSEKKSEPKPDKEPVSSVAPIIKPEEVKAEPIQPEPVPTLQKKERIGDNAIILAATEPVPLAVFLQGSDLYMAVSKNDLVLAPKISGPSALKIGPFRGATLEDGQAFKGPILPQAALRTQGGGLVWRVLVTDADEGPKRNPLAPVWPQRVMTPGQPSALLWPFKQARAVMHLPDPATGENLIIVTTGIPGDNTGTAMDYVDFSTLHSLAGLIIRPRVDDLSVKITPQGVEVTRPQGLSILPQNLVDMMIANRQTQVRAQESKAADAQVGNTYIYNFMGWQMGGPEEMRRNRNIILPSLVRKDAEGAVQGLLTLGKMYLSNGFWAEAEGLLQYALASLPELKDNPEFLALRGAAQVLGYQSERAFATLSADLLKPYGEIGFWRAFSLGDLGDWRQAEIVMPPHAEILERYPPVILGRIGPMLAEVALRGGKRDLAEKILAMLDKQGDSLLPPQKAALEYLKGELARQNKQLEETERIWTSLEKGNDELYRTKAGLALTRLQTEQGKLNPQQAIDRLERLRYSWRGDELEAQVNYWLGRTYFDQGQYSRGLNIMREAATFAGSTNLAQRIATEMRDSFIDLFMSDKLQKVPAVDAAAIYEDFAELAPPGATNDQIMQKLAERLVSGDLLGKASAILKKLVDHRLQGAQALTIGTRLAAIELIDSRPQDALRTLDKMDKVLGDLPESERTADRAEALLLLRARAISQQGHAPEAIALLRDKPRSRNINRLQADIAWRAGFWDDAAEALEEVVADQNISLTRPLSNDNAALLMNWALAMNLAGDRVGLANMREQYTDAMAQTDKARVFDVISRPRQSVTLADRERLMSIVSEVDLFADFLENYRNVRAP